MFTLGNRPPSSVVVDGTEYRLFLEFDNVLNLFDLFNDTELEKKEKFFIALKILFDDDEIEHLYDDLEYLEKLLTLVIDEFITMDSNKNQLTDILGNPIELPEEEQEEKEKVYDLKQDAEYIYASFMQDYHIDLHSQLGKMHWHTFQALLNGLSENTRFKKVIEIIQMELPTGKGSQKERERIKKLKQQYKLN